MAHPARSVHPRSPQVELILARYPKNYKAAGIIPMLDLAQRQVRLESRHHHATAHYRTNHTINNTHA